MKRNKEIFFDKLKNDIFGLLQLKKIKNSKKKKHKRKTKKVFKKTIKKGGGIKRKTCKKVPCGVCVTGCETSYCLNGDGSGGSKNWCICNMRNKPCHNKKPIKYKAPKFQVTVKKMNRRLPLVWRHLKNKTRKKLIKTANMPLKKLNIKYMKHN